MRLLDADVLIDLIRGFPPATTWLASLGDEETYLPGYVVMEVVQGCRDQRELRRVLRPANQFSIVWASAGDSERALRTFARYYLSHSLGPFDALIAECAIGLGATLCTFNLKHFRIVDQLMTEQPYAK
jgi:predicted nucleic acid-binding protein